MSSVEGGSFHLTPKDSRPINSAHNPTHENHLVSPITDSFREHPNIATGVAITIFGVAAAAGLLSTPIVAQTIDRMITALQN